MVVCCSEVMVVIVTVCCGVLQCGDGGECYCMWLCVAVRRWWYLLLYVAVC